MMYTAVSLALMASSALAHFTLDYPTSRGFDDDNEPQFCGGFNSVENPRQPFPLGEGPVWIGSHHADAAVVAFLSTSDNPTSFNDFNTTSSGQSIPLVTNFFTVHEGEYCWNIDLNDLNIGLTNGSLVTLQIQYNGGDGDLYQCTDLVLLSDYTIPSNVTCSSNDDATTTNGTQTVSLAGASSTGASASGSATSSAATQSSSSSSGAATHNAVGGTGLVAAVLSGLLAWATL